MASNTSDLTPRDLAHIYHPHIPLNVSIPQLTHRMALLSTFSCLDFSPSSTLSSAHPSSLASSNAVPSSINSSSSTPSTSTSSPSNPSSANACSIPHILEIGCGQGDTTAALLALVGPHGHVTAIDPGDPDYGSPLTLGEAQGLVQKWAEARGLGVSFSRSDAVAFAARWRSGESVEGTVEKAVRKTAEEVAGKMRGGKGEGKRFDVAVLAKCLWYFPSREAVRETLRAVAEVARRVCVAEYALSCVEGAGTAHVEACRAQGLLYEAIVATGVDSSIVVTATEEFLSQGSNLRVLLTGSDIKELAADVGLRCVREGVVQSSAQKDLQDGMWDSGQVVLGERFLKRVEAVEAYLGGDVVRRKELCARVREARERAVEEMVRLGGHEGTREERVKKGLKEVRTMDVWVGEFESA